MASIVLKLAMAVISILLLGPFVGGLLSGTDRFLSARMQRRQGPPVLQPFYDISKFFQKKAYIVNGLQHFLVVGHLLFLMLSIGIIYAGQDILLSVFSLTLAEMMLCLAAFSASAPYSNMSAQREMLQMACAAPILLLLCIGLYLSSGSFLVKDIIRCDLPAIVKTPGIFFAFLIALPIELRKSPFDVSTSHHAHQEMVKGVTTEMGADNLALFQLSEWYETVFLMGVVGLFFINENPWSYLVAILAILAVYFLEILIDNTSARVKWDTMLKLAWGVTLFAAGTNLIILMIAR